jgi:hypothetical protein
MKLLLTIPFALLAFAQSPGTFASQSTAAPIRLELSSSDSLRPVIAQLTIEGRAVNVGARLPRGRVELTGNTGIITTPAVLELADGPVVLELRALTAATDAVLEVRPSTGRIERIVATGGTLRLERGMGGGLQFTGDGIETKLRAARSR